MMSVNDSELLNSITKLLYPAISKKNSTTPTRVERAIRHAIEVTWYRGGINTIDNQFGYKLKSGNNKPTNLEFVASITDIIKLKYKMRA